MHLIGFRPDVRIEQCNHQTAILVAVSLVGFSHSQDLTKERIQIRQLKSERIKTRTTKTLKPGQNSSERGEKISTLLMEYLGSMRFCWNRCGLF